jgi:hypothetical protein
VRTSPDFKRDSQVTGSAAGIDSSGSGYFFLRKLNIGNSPEWFNFCAADCITRQPNRAVLIAFHRLLGEI